MYMMTLPSIFERLLQRTSGSIFIFFLSRGDHISRPIHWEGQYISRFVYPINQDICAQLRVTRFISSGIFGIIFFMIFNSFCSMKGVCHLLTKESHKAHCMIRNTSVSYTHLTLPTTPYV